MSYANGTQFYNLPQTIGTDKRDWFDTNEPFAAIDAALHAAATGQAADAEAIATINASLATDEAAIAALQTASSTQDASISALQTAVSGQAAQIADVRQDAEDMISAYNEGAAETSTHTYSIGDYFIYNDVLYKATAAIAIGDTIVPNTNCQATNVTTEINEINNDLVVTKIATSPSTGTLSAKLNSLFTALHALSHQKKARSYLIVRSANNEVAAITPCQGLSYDGSTPMYKFSGTSADSNSMSFTCAQVMSSSSIYGNAGITSGGYAFQDYSSVENNQYFELWA